MKPGLDWDPGPPLPAPDAGFSSEASSTALREILTHVFRDRWRIGAALGLGLILTVLCAMLPSAKYTAEAALLLRLGREYIYTPEVGDPQAGTPVAYDREQILLAESRILSSREIQERVIEKIGLQRLFPGLEDRSSKQSDQAAFKAFESALKAELLKGSNLMQVSFTHKDPQVAADVLTEVIEAYLVRRMAIFASSTAGTAQAEFDQRRQLLNDVESRISALKEKQRFRAFTEEQSLLLSQRNAIEIKLAEARLSLSQSAGRAGALREEVQSSLDDVTLSSETQRSEAAEGARRTLLDLRLKERDLSSKFAETHPLVLDVRADLRRTEEFLKELERNPVRTQKTGRNPTRDVAESELLRAQAEQRQAQSGVAQLLSLLAQIEQRLGAFADSERELISLERDRRLAEQNYEAAAKRLRDERALQDLDRKRRSNVSIVQPPVVPTQATSIAPLILAVGTVLSLCGALLVAFLSALWRDSFSTPQEVERALRIPVLASIPKQPA
jgi:uncharacterized protein involved in exopolysaccharide biosynthesis